MSTHNEQRAYDPSDWYWQIAETGEIYSSAARTTIAAGNPAYLSFLSDGGVATTINTMDALKAVLSEQAAAGLPPDLPAFAAQCRWELETGGITVSGMPVSTTRESQALINGAYSFAIVDPAATFQFKAETGFVTLDADTVKAVALAVASHVQACFAWEANALNQISNGQLVSEADIRADRDAFAASMVS